MPNYGSGRSLHVFDDHGSTDCKQLGGTAHHHRCRKTCCNNCICAKFGSLRNHSIEALLTAFGDQLGVFVDFPADYISQASHDVLTDVPRAHRVAANEAQGFDDSLVRNCLAGYHYHGSDLHIFVFVRLALDQPLPQHRDEEHDKSSIDGANDQLHMGFQSRVCNEFVDTNSTDRQQSAYE